MTSSQLVSLRTTDVVRGGREATTGNTSAVRGLPVGLLAQLRLERCTGIAKVKVPIPAALIFSCFLFATAPLSCVFQYYILVKSN